VTSSPTTGFAVALRRERESAGLTQAELADRAGLGVRTVSNLERGINTSPYPSTVRLLADALGLLATARGGLIAAAGRGAEDAGPDRALTGGFLGAAPVGRLVARDTEATAITTAITAAAASRSGVVLLTGEPGIGKTRLAQEASIRAAESGFLVVSGRCYEQRRDTPFVPLFEAFGALSLAAPRSVRDGLIERWPALVTLLPDEFSAHELTAWSSPDAAEALHRAATGLVREIAGIQPVAILLDDLHWADAATVELLLHLVRHTAADRLLLLGTFRDAEVGSAHPVRRLVHALHRERHVRATSVGRFDRSATARLIAQRLDGATVADSLSELVHAHADGNPFFTAEIVTALVDRGDLEQVAGAWACREETEVEVPASVREVVNERFARLSTAARDVLEAGSVLGEVFDPDDVAVAAEEELLEAALDDAVGSGLLTTADGRYAFDHVLTQQALYAGLSPVRRRRWHRTVGEMLGRRPESVRRRRSAEIARHLEAGGSIDLALPYVLLAGDLAAAVFSQVEATRLYLHARELAEEVGDEASGTTALQRLGQLEVMTGRYDDALGHLLEAAERHRLSGDAASRLGVEGLIADLQHRRGEGEAAASRLENLLTELEIGTGSDDWVAGGAALANGLARVRIFLGQHQLCVEATELARRLARQEGSTASEAEACAVGGTALFFLDRPDEAVQVFEEGVALAAGIDAPTLESGVLMGLQWAATMRGAFPRSIALGERGLELTHRSGNTDQESQHAAGLGHALYYTGDWAEAERHLVRGVELARSGSPTLFSGVPPIYLGVLRAAQGDAAAATACYDEAATAPDIQTFAYAGYLQARRAELDLRDGDAAGALARLEPWLGEESPTKVHDTMLLVAAAEACLALGDTARAEFLVARALRRAEATGNRVDGIDARRLQGRCHRLGGRDDEARRCLEEALALAIAVEYPAAVARVRAELG
jgi:transcriptional regulator with XRE-family HTH domain/tetratricopeptide (TPR) repeat protein